VAPKNPVGKLAETALSTLKDPKGAAGRVVDQAKGAVALGKIAADTAGSVVGRAAGRKGKKAPARPQAPTTQARQEPPAPTGLRAVPDVNEPAHTQPPGPATGATAPAAEPRAKTPAAPKPAAPKPAASKPAAKKSADSPKKSADSPKKQGDPVAKSPAAKTAAGAKAAPKPAASKPAAKKSAVKTSPAAKKAAATPADVAEVVEAAVAKDPKKTAAQPAKKTASTTAKKGTAKKAPAKKSSPGGKLPARKSPEAGGSGTNPATGKPSATQGSEGSVLDPSVAKQVASESETLKKAAETDPS